MSEPSTCKIVHTCQDCGVKLNIHSSATNCDNCAQKKYEKNNPDWKKDHPCQMCDKPVHYPEGLSYLTWGCSYYSCCSDECRQAYLELQLL